VPALRGAADSLPAMHYLDHAATTPLRPEARAAMEPFLGGEFGNPSGVHAVSRRAKDALEEARERVAALLGAAHPLEVVFTGGGTESDNLGVAGPVLAGGRRRGVVTTAVEHEAVLETARFLGRLGCPVGVVGVDREGRVDPERVAAAAGPETAVVSVMAANNETGALQPVAAVASAVRARAPGTVVHTDAVQAFVTEPIDAGSLGVDLITLASHKAGGPKGVGLLWVRPGVDLEPVLHGGGQEAGRRSGTHDVAGIVGMAAALEAAAAGRERLRRDLSETRSRFEERLAAVGAIPTVAVGRLAQHCHVRIPGVRAESLLVRLDRAGVAASAGSACQSGALQTSHVLAAMGMDPEAAAECVRFTFGWTSTAAEAEAAAAVVCTEVEALRCR
jgi:cysteine desulfurase